MMWLGLIGGCAGVAPGDSPPVDTGTTPPNAEIFAQCGSVLPEVPDAPSDPATEAACGAAVHMFAGAAWGMGSTECMQLVVTGTADGLVTVERAVYSAEDVALTRWTFACGGEVGDGAWLVSTTILDADTRAETAEVRWDPPVLWAPASLEATGEIWAGTSTYSTSESNGRDVEYSLEVGDHETIETPAGTFDAVPVSVIAQTDDARHRIWYAEGVGPVYWSYYTQHYPTMLEPLLGWRDAQ